MFEADIVIYSIGISLVLPDMESESGFRRLQDYHNYKLTHDEEIKLLYFCLSLGPQVLTGECV